MKQDARCCCRHAWTLETFCQSLHAVECLMYWGFQSLQFSSRQMGAGIAMTVVRD
jgi:hypothetical protein